MRKGSSYPVLYYHPLFVRGKYSQLVKIHRNGTNELKHSIDSDEIDRINEEYFKLSARYNELFESAMQLRKQITARVEENKAELLEHSKFRFEFCDNARKAILYFYLKSQYMDADVIVESSRVMKDEQKYFDPEAKFDLKDICSNVPTVVGAYLQKAIFYTYPTSDFVKKSLNIVFNAMARKMGKFNDPQWQARVNTYLIDDKPNDTMHMTEGWESIKDIKEATEDIFRSVFNKFEEVLGKTHDNEEHVDTTDEPNGTRCLSSNTSQRDRFSVRTLENLLVLEGHDLLLSAMPSWY